MSGNRLLSQPRNHGDRQRRLPGGCHEIQSACHDGRALRRRSPRGARRSQYNVGVPVVRRNKIEGRTLHDALVHDAVTEVYRIIEGSGVLITGGTLESPKPLTDDAGMRELGPSSQGKYITGGMRTRVGPGDIVIIPPHTPHGFIEITTDHMDPMSS